MPSSLPRSTSGSRGASIGSQIHAAYKAKATIPRIRRSAILRAIDRLAGRKISNTLGSTDIIASECVTLGNSDGTAESIGEAGFASINNGPESMQRACSRGSLDGRIFQGQLVATRPTFTLTQSYRFVSASTTPTRQGAVGLSNPIRPIFRIRRRPAARAREARSRRPTRARSNHEPQNKSQNALTVREGGRPIALRHTIRIRRRTDAVSGMELLWNGLSPCRKDTAEPPDRIGRLQDRLVARMRCMFLLLLAARWSDCSDRNARERER
jgi:hypothetical protein